MKLPVLNYPEGKTLNRSTCHGTDQCSGCKLFVKNEGRCGGCTPDHKALLSENYVACFKECNTCGGGGFDDVEAPSVCCRSPLKDIYMQSVAGDDWNNPKRTYHERPAIKLKKKAVFYVTAGSIGTIVREDDGYLVPPDTEAVAVSLARVWTGKRFASDDMHDYLRMPRKTKLMLFTMNRDDILESAWNAELYADPHKLQQIGFTSWMPIAFSSYRGDAHMQQYFNFLRTTYCIDKSQAWWFVGNYRRPGLRLEDMFDEIVAKVPQIVFNTQFLVSEEITKKALLDVKWFHERYPKNVAFWMVGTATPTFFHNVRKHVGDRDVYWVSGNPHHFATQGKEFAANGNGKKSRLPKHELVTANMKSFQDLVTNYG